MDAIIKSIEKTSVSHLLTPASEAAYNMLRTMSGAPFITRFPYTDPQFTYTGACSFPILPHRDPLPAAAVGMPDASGSIGVFVLSNRPVSVIYQNGKKLNGFTPSLENAYTTAALKGGGTVRTNSQLWGIPADAIASFAPPNFPNMRLYFTLFVRHFDKDRDDTPSLIQDRSWELACRATWLGWPGFCYTGAIDSDKFHPAGWKISGLAQKRIIATSIGDPLVLFRTQVETDSVHLIANAYSGKDVFDTTTVSNPEVVIGNDLASLMFTLLSSMEVFVQKLSNQSKAIALTQNYKNDEDGIAWYAITEMLNAGGLRNLLLAVGGLEIIDDMDTPEKFLRGLQQWADGLVDRLKNEPNKMLMLNNYYADVTQYRATFLDPNSTIVPASFCKWVFNGIKTIAGAAQIKAASEIRTPSFGNALVPAAVADEMHRKRTRVDSEVTPFKVAQGKKKEDPDKEVKLRAALAAQQAKAANAQKKLNLALRMAAANSAGQAESE